MGLQSGQLIAYCDLLAPLSHTHSLCGSSCQNVAQLAAHDLDQVQVVLIGERGIVSPRWGGLSFPRPCFLFLFLEKISDFFVGFDGSGFVRRATRASRTYFNVQFPDSLMRPPCPPSNIISRRGFRTQLNHTIAPLRTG
jgi:hypothetical protein